MLCSFAVVFVVRLFVEVGIKTWAKKIGPGPCHQKRTGVKTGLLFSVTLNGSVAHVLC